MHEQQVLHKRNFLGDAFFLFGHNFPLHRSEYLDFHLAKHLIRRKLGIVSLQVAHNEPLGRVTPRKAIICSSLVIVSNVLVTNINALKAYSLVLRVNVNCSITSSYEFLYLDFSHSRQALLKRFFKWLYQCKAYLSPSYFAYLLIRDGHLRETFLFTDFQTFYL